MRLYIITLLSIFTERLVKKSAKPGVADQDLSRIARGLYRAYDMIILDEPTAAIDPIDEDRVYRMFLIGYK
jgi:ABC-type sugar transport system ATPase subunit